jgi:hypothetical protein
VTAHLIDESVLHATAPVLAPLCTAFLHKLPIQATGLSEVPGPAGLGSRNQGQTPFRIADASTDVLVVGRSWLSPVKEIEHATTIRNLVIISGQDLLRPPVPLEKVFETEIRVYDLTTSLHAVLAATGICAPAAALGWRKLVYVTSPFDSVVEDGRLTPSFVGSAPEVVNNAAQRAILALAAPKSLTDYGLALQAAAEASGVVLPPPTLTADGEMMFYARKGRAYLDLGINCDGTYSFFCRDAEGHEYLSDEDVRIESGLDENVRRVLRDLA